MVNRPIDSGEEVVRSYEKFCSQSDGEKKALHVCEYLKKAISCLESKKTVFTAEQMREARELVETLTGLIWSGS